MAVTLNGVSARVVSVVEQTTDLGLEAQVEYHCPWSQRHSFLLGLAGDVVTTGSQSSGTVTRRIPHLYPDSPTDIPLYAVTSGVKLTPLGPAMQRADGWVEYGKVGANGLARVEATYRPLEYDPDDQVIYEESIDGAGQFLTLPGRPYTVGGVPIGQDIAIYMPQINVQRTFRFASYIDDRIFTTAGKVNDATFKGQAAGTWLFGEPQVRVTRTALGTITRDVTVSLIWRSQPWNYVLNPSTGTWGLVSPTIYSSASFGWLG